MNSGNLILTDLFFAVMVTVFGYWAGKLLSPFSMQSPVRLLAGVLCTPALSGLKVLSVSEKNSSSETV